MAYRQRTDSEIVVENMTEFDRLQADFHLTGRTVRDDLRARLTAAKVKFHFVTYRVKDRVSYEKKLAHEPRRSPEDIVGVRIILYFQEDVAHALTIVRQALEVDESTMVDKAQLLRPREFGYRSVQLVGRERPPEPLSGEPPFKNQIMNFEWMGIRKGSVEVQIRSILEHAWASIDHDYVYKSEYKVSEAVHRRFAATAAMLEVVDENLVQIRNDVVLDLAPAATAHEPEDGFIKRFIETDRESKALDQRIISTLGVPKGYPLGVLSLLGDAIWMTSWNGIADLRYAVANYSDLAYRVAVVCVDPARSLLSGDFYPYSESKPLAYAGIGLFWLAVTHGSTIPGHHEMNKVPPGRVREYAEVVRYLSENPELSPLAVRDRYREVAAPNAAKRYPQISLG